MASMSAFSLGKTQAEQDKDTEGYYKALASSDAIATKYGYASPRSSNSSVSSISNTGNSLFGSEGANSLFSGKGFDGLIGSAKDLAQFRLGLDKDQATFSSGLRETEAQGNYGRNYKLADQQIQGQMGLEGLRQDSTTKRLEEQLANQSKMQQSGFDQQNTFRAQSAALALRGLK